jgi:DNA repair exonuclease SbcCD ATPase subunit
MKFRNLHLEGFGVLAGLRLDDLEEGLTVIHGPNGSGKTTVLQFIRGLFLGFSEARRLRLLPPLRGGTSGGSAIVTDQDGRFTVIRHARGDTSDTLAINARQGTPEDARELRTTVENLNPDLIHTLYTVGNLEAHAVDRLVRLALRDGIDLESRKAEATWLREHLDTVRAERADLLTTPPGRGRIDALEKQKAQLKGQIETFRGAEQSRQEDNSEAIAHLRQQTERLAREIDWLHAELQATQADLTECQNRLWNRTQRTVRQVRRISTPAAPEPSPLEAIEEIDRQIEHCRQVLRDIAVSRKQLSIASAALVGADVPTAETTFDRERRSLRNLESHLHRLDGLVHQILEAQQAGRCLCDATQQSLTITADGMRDHIYLLCQELNRRQKIEDHRRLISKRKGVDRIEQELKDRVGELRLRRDALLASQANEDRERIRHRADLESAGCECEGHAAVARTSAAVPLRSVETTEEIETVVEESLARPGDAGLEKDLKARAAQLWSQWQSAQQKLADCERLLAGAVGVRTSFAHDERLQALQYDYAVIEQELADASEQWQALMFLQATFHHAQRQLETVQHPRVIADASESFTRLTQGRYLGFRYDPRTQELYVQPARGELQATHSLSRGTLDQAALSLRLALADEYARRGFQFPLVFDDVLVDSDENRLRIAVELLQQACQRGHQILFLTCQDRLTTLFHDMGVPVRGLDRPWVRDARFEFLSSNDAGRLTPNRLAELTVEATTTRFDPPEPPLSRSQPDVPFWLEPDSPAGIVPSLGAQMGRRLGALGISTVADLIELDPEATELPLSSLQVTAAQLRVWQAEARLLCCVPDITGRDAQLLVACDIFSPTELAEVDQELLLTRIARLRATEARGFDWIHDDATAPDLNQVRRWTGYGRRARTLAQAMSDAGWTFDDEESDSLPMTGAAESESDDFDPNDRPTGGVPHLLTPRRARRGKARRVARGRTNRSGSRPSLRLTGSRSAEAVEDGGAPRNWQFYLEADSPVVDAPSIGPKMAERLREVGVVTVTDLVGRSPASISSRLDDSKITPQTITEWQQQAMLMCRVPELRGHDAQLLVACNVTTAEALAGQTPAALWAIMEPFLKTRDAARMLRSSKAPDLAEIQDWIQWAQHARQVRAA